MAMAKKKTTPKIVLKPGGEGAGGAVGGAAARAVAREVLSRKIAKAAAKGVQATAKINKKDIGAKAAKAVKEQNKAARLMITKSQSAINAGKKAAQTKKIKANELARKQGIKNKLKGAASGVALGYGLSQAQKKKGK